jgi:hypothetical protein
MRTTVLLTGCIALVIVGTLADVLTNDDPASQFFPDETHASAADEAADVPPSPIELDVLASEIRSEHDPLKRAVLVARYHAAAERLPSAQRLQQIDRLRAIRDR